MQYRNRGAPFTRDDGSTWNTDAVHEPTENELVRRTYKLRPVLNLTPTSPPAVTDEQETAWPLKMTPEIYLRLHPDGDHAELARTFVPAPEPAPAPSDPETPPNEEVAEAEEDDHGADE